MENEVETEVQLEGQTTTGPEVGAAESVEEMAEILCQPVYLTASHVLVGLGDSEKTSIQKAISYEDFYQALTEVMQKEVREAKSNLLLPSNCFFLGYSGSALNLNVYYPETTETILYGTKSFTGRVPNMILSFSLVRGKTKNEWKMSTAKYFCTDIPVSMLPHGFISSTDYSSRIFLSPFWNTYIEGTMCHGNNTMPGTFVKGNLRGLDYYYQFLFKSPFNNDLGIRGVPGKESSEWISELKKGAKESKFPYEHLRGYTPQS